MCNFFPSGSKERMAIHHLQCTTHLISHHHPRFHHKPLCNLLLSRGLLSRVHYPLLYSNSLQLQPALSFFYQIPTLLPSVCRLVLWSPLLPHHLVFLLPLPFKCTPLNSHNYNNLSGHLPLYHPLFPEHFLLVFHNIHLLHLQGLFHCNQQTLRPLLK